MIPQIDIELISLFSETTGSFVRESNEDVESLSTAEEEFSDTTNEEDEYRSEFKTPDEEPELNEASSGSSDERYLIRTPQFDDDLNVTVSSSDKAKSRPRDSIKLSSILRKSLEFVTVPFQRILEDISVASSNAESVQMMQREKSEIQRIPIPAQPLPTSQTVVEYQIFLCDCLCAFPTRGQLISHKAHCNKSNS